jgi:hypothetical protein
MDPVRDDKHLYAHHPTDICQELMAIKWSNSFTEAFSCAAGCGRDNSFSSFNLKGSLNVELNASYL